MCVCAVEQHCHCKSRSRCCANGKERALTLYLHSGEVLAPNLNLKAIELDNFTSTA